MGLKLFSRKRDSKQNEIPQTEKSGTPGQVITVQVEDGSQRQVKLLDNPLKLPPKHTHKAMDFDVDISDNDDFDV